MKAKSHHYNPQVYLRQFTNPAAKKELWEYDLIKGVAKKSKPKDCGCEDYYNSVALRGGQRDDETIEEVFHPLENPLPELFEAIRNKHLMTDKLWNLFFSFAAIQEARGPSTVSTLHDFESKIYQAGFEMLCKHSVVFQEKLRAKGIEPQEALADYEVQATKGSALLLSLGVIENTARILSRIKWGFACPSPGKFFITSDRPICRWVPSDKRNIYSGGLTDRDAEITFPLSRRICACGHWTESWSKTYKEVSAEDVDEINRRTVWNAHNFVYGPTSDSKIMEIVQGRANARRNSCQPTETK